VSSVTVRIVQVEDVDKKFVELDKLQAAGWVMARQTPVKPKRVIVSTNSSAVHCAYILLDIVWVTSLFLQRSA